MDHNLVVSLDEITKDRETIQTIHKTAMRSRNCEVLALLLGNVNRIVGKYNRIIEENPRGALSSLRVALRYFKYAEKSIDTRIMSLQKSYISRNIKNAERRENLRNIELLARTKTEASIDKMNKNTQHTIASVLLERLNLEGYDPLAPPEIRRQQVEKIIADKPSDIPTGDEFLKLLEPENLDGQ